MIFDLKKYLYSHNFAQFIKFSIVGCSNLIVSFTVFYLFYHHWKISNILRGDESIWYHAISGVLHRLGMRSFDGTYANLCGYTAGILNSFIWNKIWTFQVIHETSKQFKRFIILNIFCLILSTIGIFIFIDLLDLPYKTLWLALTVLITFLNYFGNKRWVFQNNSPANLVDAME